MSYLQSASPKYPVPHEGGFWKVCLGNFLYMQEGVEYVARLWESF